MLIILLANGIPHPINMFFFVENKRLQQIWAKSLMLDRSDIDIYV